MTEIVLQGVTFRYDEQPVVEKLDLRVEAGTMFGLLGPSGCGKTTILRMIAGLLEPDSGEILFDGSSVLHIPPEKRRIGMVFQHHVLFPHMTVEENVAFGLRMQGVSPRAARPRVDEVLELVQLAGYNLRFPKQLSGGQQQRVALARAVITSPVVLLLDEPLSNLDARLRDDMRTLLRDVQGRLGITTVFVTHDQTEAIEMSDRMVVLFPDGIAQEGPPHEVFERPVNARVARFLGSTNLVPARRCGEKVDSEKVDSEKVDSEKVDSEKVAGEKRNSAHNDEEGCRDDPRLRVETPFGRLVLHERNGNEERGEFSLSIRCEFISLVGPEGEGAAESSDNSFRGVVDSSVYKGGLIFYRVRVEGFLLDVIDRSDRQFVPGAEVTVIFPPEHLWLLPPAPPDSAEISP